MAAAHNRACCKSRARIPQIVRQNCLPKATQKISGSFNCYFLKLLICFNILSILVEHFTSIASDSFCDELGSNCGKRTAEHEFVNCPIDEIYEFIRRKLDML
jgi:hypothetical protein